jgi:uncharacterized membrane protein
MLTTAVIQTIISGISVAIGFLIAFIADPIKASIERRAKRERLKRALYGEIMGIYADILLYIKLSKEGKTHNIESLLSFNCDVYEFAKKDLLLFYEVKEASQIKDLYRNIEIFSSRVKSLSQEDSLNLAIQIKAVTAYVPATSEGVFPWTAVASTSRRFKPRFRAVDNTERITAKFLAPS